MPVDVDALLSECKNYLDITWDDSDGDLKLKGILLRGMDSLNRRLGECDFSAETQEKALLFDYVMYARAGEIPQFFVNYRGELMSLQLSKKVEAYAKSEE